MLGIFHNLNGKPHMTLDQILYDVDYYELELVCLLRFLRQFLLDEIEATTDASSGRDLSSDAFSAAARTCLCPPLVERWACLDRVTVRAKGLTSGDGKKLNGLEGALMGRKVFPFEKKYYDISKISPDEWRFCVDFGGEIGVKSIRGKNLDIVTELKPLEPGVVGESLRARPGES